MLGKMVPLLISVLGLGAGVGAGLALRPPPQHEPVGEDAALACPPGSADGLHATTPADAGAQDYVKLNNQFVVPVVEGGEVRSLVVLSITLEVATGQSEAVYDREPKLRDVFLQVLFDHANAGGFAGSFTAATPMTALRTALREVARQTLGPSVSDVLIVDIVRQDV